MSDFSMKCDSFSVSTKDAGHVATVTPFFFPGSEVAKMLTVAMSRNSYVPDTEEILSWIMEAKTKLKPAHVVSTATKNYLELNPDELRQGINDSRAEYNLKLKLYSGLNTSGWFKINLYFEAEKEG